MSDAAAAPPRSEKELLIALRPFAVESPLRSWWCVLSTLAVLAGALACAAAAPWLALRLAGSLLAGLTLVRAFILYHDHMHGALLARSWPAAAIFQLFGLLMLTPARNWRYSHNYHHAHVGKTAPPKPGEPPLLTSDVGAFPLMSTESYRQATWRQKLEYRINRHPLTILLAYVTVFLYSLTVTPLLRNPRKNWDGALALLAHGALLASVGWFAGWQTLLIAVVIPTAIAACLGAYLFYAQHAYEDLHLLPPEEWTYCRGALESSSYMRLDPVLNWFTGNIGYHHIHHLNAQIPFYRLPEAMAAFPELQHPTTTSLRPRDIWSCFRANLWDLQAGRMVSYREATRAG